MANRKLDMSKAWSETTALISANRDTIVAIAGLFFFLPSLALALLAPEIANPPQPAAGPGGDPQAAMQAMVEQMSSAYSDNWGVLLGLTVAQFIGSLSLLALLTDRARPTVGEALVKGLRSSPSYLAAQILSALLAGLVVGLPIVVATVAFGSPVAIVLLVFVLLLVALYMFVKFSLVAPVIVIDGERNPIAALMRSWRLTKGNSFRILVFVLLLLLIIGIVAALVSGLIGLVLSAFGTHIASVGNGIIGAIVNAVIGVIFLVVTAAIHRQLAGQSPERLAATFE